MLFDFLIKKHECQHNNVPIDVEEAYCPDCGAFIQNKWFLVRCSCCNIKRSAHTKYNEIVPDTKFCPNCGKKVKNKYYSIFLSNKSMLIMFIINYFSPSIKNC